MNIANAWQSLRGKAVVFRWWVNQKTNTTAKQRLAFLYDVIIVVLALVSVVMTLMDLLGASLAKHPFFYPIDTAILILFAIDYVVRLWLSKDRPRFFRKNIFDLLALIPISTVFNLFRMMRVMYIFRVARLAKLIQLTKLARLVTMGGRLKSRADQFLHMNGLIYVIYLNIASILFGAVAIYLLEKGTTVQSFADALWWSFVTSTTVGYGDISPSTAAGRIVAVILMIFGIGLVSMLTGTIASYFTIRNEHSGRRQSLDQLRRSAKHLSDEQLEELIRALEKSKHHAKK